MFSSLAFVEYWYYAWDVRNKYRYSFTKHKKFNHIEGAVYLCLDLDSTLYHQIYFLNRRNKDYSSPPLISASFVVVV